MPRSSQDIKDQEKVYKELLLINGLESDIKVISDNRVLDYYDNGLGFKVNGEDYTIRLEKVIKRKTTKRKKNESIRFGKIKRS
jgi:hypothetical protein